MTLMKDAASVEIARRHPYLIKFGGRAVAGLAVVLALVLVWWALSSAVSSADELSLPSIPRPSTGPVLTVVAVLLLALVVGTAVAWWRSPMRTPRMGWFR